MGDRRCSSLSHDKSCKCDGHASTNDDLAKRRYNFRHMSRAEGGRQPASGAFGFRRSMDALMGGERCCRRRRDQSGRSTYLTAPLTNQDRNCRLGKKYSLHTNADSAKLKERSDAPAVARQALTIRVACCTALPAQSAAFGQLPFGLAVSAFSNAQNGGCS